MVRKLTSRGGAWVPYAFECSRATKLHGKESAEPAFGWVTPRFLPLLSLPKFAQEAKFKGKASRYGAVCDQKPSTEAEAEG